MRPLRTVSAIIAGVLLATLPFWRYAAGEHDHGKAHGDHSPHHGGQLGMVGNHHVEVLRSGGRLEVFVSDAHRRPVDATSGRVVFDAGMVVTLAPAEGRLVGNDFTSAHELEVEASLTDGTSLTIAFVFPKP